MNTIYKLIFTWMLTIVGSLLLPIMSVADVSDTMYGAPFTTTTPSVFITEHTVSLRSTPLGINGNTSIAHPVDTWNIIKNDYSSRWNSGDIREMGSVVGEGLITLLTAGVKYADNAGRLGKTGAFIQKLRKIKNLKRLRKLKASKSAKLYHYTGANPNKIAAEGLIPGGSGKVFTTPSGKLSPLQAQLDLALPPNRGLPNHLLEIDIPTLQGMGMKVPQEGPVGRMFNMPGGGTEIVFPHAIPAEAIKVVR